MGKGWWVCKIFSFNAIAPDLLFVFCAVAFSQLSYLKTLTQNDWHGEMAGRSAWVIDYGLKWHQSFWGTMWFLPQQLSWGNVVAVLSLRGIHVLLALHVTERRQKCDTLYPRICFSLILWNAGRPDCLQHLWFLQSPLLLCTLFFDPWPLYLLHRIPGITSRYQWSFSNKILYIE